MTNKGARRLHDGGLMPLLRLSFR